MKPLMTALSIIFLSSFLLAATPNPMDLDSPNVTASGEIILESNDAGESVTMSPGQYTEYMGIETMNGDEFLLYLVDFLTYKKTFLQVAEKITPLMEEAFDVFIFINVNYQSRDKDHPFIPSQHMRVVRRTSDGQEIFDRDAMTGQVNGVLPTVKGNDGTAAYDCLGSELIAISSGAGHKPPDKYGEAYTDTTTGIYRINEYKTADLQRGKSHRPPRGGDLNSPKKQWRLVRTMFNPIYFDLYYPKGTSGSSSLYPVGTNLVESGLAIHGTSPKNERRLGTQASHGCVRTTTPVSKCLKDNVFAGFQPYMEVDHFPYRKREDLPAGLNSAMYDEDLPELDNTKRLKSELYEGGALVTKPGSKTLIILFYGYDETHKSITI